MAPKCSLDTPPGLSRAAKRARKTTPSIVKSQYQANFNRLCVLHDWTPSAAARDKFARLLHLSGNRLQASELLPLAFVQHYPFLWVNDLLLLGYNESDVSVWFKAYPTGRGIARGHYFNSMKENIAGKNTVTKYWQSWIDVFDIEQRGQDRMHEFFTGVYLILKEFPNLRYKTALKGKGLARDPQNIVRTTGIAEYPFNDDHPFMQEGSDETTDAKDYELEDVDGGDKKEDNSFIIQERTASHAESDRSTPLNSSLSTPHESPTASREMDASPSLSPSRHVTNELASMQSHQKHSNSPVFRSQSQQDMHEMTPSSPVQPDEQATPNETRLRARRNGRKYPLEHPSVRPITRALNRRLGSSLVSLLYGSGVDKRTGQDAEEDNEGASYDRPSKTSRSRIRTIASIANISKNARKTTYERDVDAVSTIEETAVPACGISTASNAPPKFKEYTILVPVEEPRWSTTTFDFAFATPVQTTPVQTNPVQTAPEEPTPGALSAVSKFGFSSLEAVDAVLVQPQEDMFMDGDSEDMDGDSEDMEEEGLMAVTTDTEDAWGDSIF
ncbi:hypothetical protein E4T39_04175 [Aureobasidium subglaciale]|nr:hypothetical protein E4T39_04175 [Aureobasidium subglaciale]